MSTDTWDPVSERLAALERRQKRSWLWLRIFAGLVLAQAAVIAYLAIPFGGAAKHPITVQAGKFEVIDRDGVVRAELSSNSAQTMLALSDARGRTQILLRENDSGFATLEFLDSNFGDRSMTLLSGSKRTFLEIRDPATRESLRLQAGAGERGLSRLDDRGKVEP